MERARSPDGGLDAVLVESNGGATNSFWYDVYIVKAEARYSTGKSAAYLYGATRSDSAYGVNLKWINASELDVEFLFAEKTKVNAAEVRFGKRKVDVRLRPGVSDPAAKPGGMLYNLKGQPHDRF